MRDEVGHVHQRLVTLAVYCRLGGVSVFAASCPWPTDTTSATVDLSGNNGVAVAATADVASTGDVASIPFFFGEGSQRE